MLIFIFLFLLIPCINLHAAGFDEENNNMENDIELPLERDETGHFLTGWWKYHFRSDPWYCEDLYSEYTTVLPSDENGGYGYFIRSLYENADGSFSYGYVFHIAAGNCVVSHEYHHEQTSNGVVTVGTSEYLVRTVGPGFTYSCTPDYYQKAENNLFDTNLPIFDEEDKEGISNYEKAGDYSSAANAEDIDNKNAEFNDSIELPRNLLVQGGYAQGLSSAYSLDKDCVFSWNQTVDTSNYLYDIDAQLIIQKVYSSGSALGTEDYYTSGWQSVNSSYHYDGAQQITKKITSEFLNDCLIEAALRNYNESTGEKMKYKGYMISHLKIRVRNRLASLSSDYVVIDINFDGATTTATVESEDGDVQDNDEYNGGSVVDLDNSVDADLSTITSILDFIRSGFGLLGSNGLIAMFSSFFVYLPGGLWTLILMGLGAVIFVGIINFLLKR